MTLQQLKYIITVAETGSISEAAKRLFISQPSLSAAIKEVEGESGTVIFNRCRAGVALTAQGMEFVGYARQVLRQMESLEARYSCNRNKLRFCVSTQHYTFVANAFAELVKRFGEYSYEFILHETQTFNIIMDVRNRYCDLGILYLCKTNENMLGKFFDEHNLHFHPIFDATPHVFICKDHPLASRETLRLGELDKYPRLNFVQGSYESPNFSEELFSNIHSDKVIKVSDRAAIVNLMIGLNGYTISSGIYPGTLHDSSIVSIPLEENEIMHIGYLLNKDRELSEMAQILLEELSKFI